MRAKTSLKTSRNVQKIDDQKEKIMKIKKKIQQLEDECIRYKAKTKRLEETISKYNKSIKDITSSKKLINNKPSLDQFEKQIQILEKTLKDRQIEYKKLLQSDKLAFCEELRIEIQTYYLEQKRLQKQISTLKFDEQILETEYHRIYEQSKGFKKQEIEIENLQKEINSLTDKLFDYHKSDIKMSFSKKLKDLYNDPNQLDSIKSYFIEEINKEKLLLEENKLKIENIKKKEEKNREYLQNIINQQIEKIKKSLN